MRRPTISEGGKLALLWFFAWALLALGLYGWLGWPVVPLSAGLLVGAWALVATLGSAASDASREVGRRAKDRLKVRAERSAA